MDKVKHINRNKAKKETRSINYSITPLLKLQKPESVEVQKEAASIKVHTNCPAKWRFVDLETGQVYGADRTGQFHLIVDCRCLEQVPERDKAKKRGRRGG